MNYLKQVTFRTYSMSKKIVCDHLKKSNLQLFVAFVFLFQLKLHFLESPLRLPEVLQVLGLPPVFAVEVGGDASDFCLQLVDQLSTAANGVGFHLFKTNLELLKKVGSTCFSNTMNSQLFIIKPDS